MGGGMKAYNMLCSVAFEVVIPNDRHRDWFPARTILMYDLVAHLLIGSALCLWMEVQAPMYEFGEVTTNAYMIINT
jgi:hypothetical protein